MSNQNRYILASLLGLAVAVTSFGCMIWINGNFSLALAVAISMTLGVAVFASTAAGISRGANRSHTNDDL